MSANQIAPIDLVVVNLYPFEKTVAVDHTFDEAIEKIDVGGPTMIRAAAKNFNDVTIITDPSDYQNLINELKTNNNQTSYEFRKNVAIKAFRRTQNYDNAIYNWFAKSENLSIKAELEQELRYGENPHQKAQLYKTDNSGIVGAKQLQGKELSYNNLNDGDAAYKIAKEFQEPFVCIVKHANPCGAAIGDDIADAFTKALNCDPVSSFGGIVALNRDIDQKTAEKLSKIFFEVIITTGITDEAQAILAKKKNLRILIIENFFQELNSRKIKSISGGLLVQDEDFKDTTKDDLNFVSNRKASNEQIAELIFANKIIKHVKSNAIIFTHNKAAIAIGAGQMSRVDAAKIASEKLSKYKEENTIDNEKLVMASDAFFPFADGLEIGIKAGITAVIQPGGSVRDDEVIAKANEYNIAMAVTGSRHFSH
jgi:phosphoribosylaminoimidazolecarboxamide formyltransferase/IMP cyclohydrolase